MYIAKVVCLTQVALIEHLDRLQINSTSFLLDDTMRLLWIHIQA